MPKLINLEQNTPEWLEYRKTKLGASDAGTILGINKYSTPRQLWLQKLGLAKEQETTQAMERGKRLETEALFKYVVEKGCLFSPMVIESNQYPFMMASLDGITIAMDKACEIKCLNMQDHVGVYDGKKISPSHYAQIQHQMIVGCLDEIDYVGYHPDSNVKPLYIITIKRDEEFIKMYLEKAKEFWDYVTTFTEPPKTERDYLDYTNNLDFRAAEAAYVDIDDKIEKLEEQKKALRNKMIELSSGNNVMGAYTKMTSYVSRGTIQYSKIPALKEIDLEIYRAPAICSTRIIRI